MLLLENIYFIQGLGILCFLCGLSGYLSKSDVHLKFFLGMAGFILALHLLLLGAYAGAGAAAIASIRAFLTIKHWAKPLAPLFFLSYAPLLLSVETIVDCLPIAAGLGGTYAMFFLSGLKMRLFLFAGTALWLIYNALQLSIGGTMLEILFLSANALTIYRMKKEKV